MAWNAELKRKRWHCINGIDMIRIYSQKLYDDWYNSLTDEQKQRLEEYRKRKLEKSKREARVAIQKLLMMTGMVAGLYNRHDKDNGIYDEFGFPRSKI